MSLKGKLEGVILIISIFVASCWWTVFMSAAEGPGRLLLCLSLSLSLSLSVSLSVSLSSHTLVCNVKICFFVVRSVEALQPYPQV